MTPILYPLKWTQALNPLDEVDYTFDLAGNLLEVGETVQGSPVLTLSAASIAAGLLTGSGSYQTALGKIVNGVFTADSTGTVIRIWFSIDPTHQADAAFDGIGTWLDMTLQVTTTNTPPRIRERTLLLRAARQ